MLTFTLKSGQYATMLLRELCKSRQGGVGDALEQYGDEKDPKRAKRNHIYFSDDDD